MKTVAVITRTYRRPRLLARALDSLLSQTYDHWCWVVVDSSASAGAAELIGANASALAGRATLIQTSNHGMPGAQLNAGLTRSSSDFITILDDDDTWAPEFLSTMTGRLNLMGTTRTKGVACAHHRILERQEKAGAGYSEVSRGEVALENIILSKAAAANPFPSNCFLYERAALDVIGMYPEDFPLMEDWHLHLRFLSQFDICATSRALANVHIRVDGATAEDQNLLSRQPGLAAFTQARLFNELLRKALAAGEFALASLLSDGCLHGLLMEQLAQRSENLDSVGLRTGKIDSRTKSLKDGLRKKPKRFSPRAIKSALMKPGDPSLE